jgi:hypothetical protein
LHLPEVTLSRPIVIHVLRPYANEDEYLAHEALSIDSKSMLLFEQPALPVDSEIVFDVQLGNGQKPIRAEAKVVGYVAATSEQPAGLRVRFKRFGAATKAFIDRAVSAGRASSLPVEPARASLRSSFSESPSALSVASSPPPSASGSPSETDAPELPVAGDLRNLNETSGIHQKALMPVAAPADREALLARLRERRAS